MSVKAEPVLLQEPLERGREGATLVIEPLHTGDAVWPPSFFASTGRGLIKRLRALGVGSSPETWETRPVPAYLARHPTVGNILVDTGLHPSVARDPRDNLGRFSGRHYRVEEGRDLVSQLRDRRLTPFDIHVVVLTHLHEDHASGIEAFPQAKFIVSATEWEAATTGSLARLKGYNRSHYDYAFDFATVDFDGDLVESYGPFGRSFDLFGDGSVRLAYTPGHSAGHMSVVLRLPRRDFVVIGDAAYDWKQFDGETEPTMMADEHNWRRSLRELQAYRRTYPYALMVPGHDSEFWEKLEPRYEE
ncbi:MAG TPA: N-acyl homoserine lactonase family protein [Solirubrobacterales bacterium]|nr:N-acyl homoserine lactonase family protein [Solirubrobacterales bacterium]